MEKQTKTKIHVPLFKIGDFNGLVYVFTGNIGSFLLVIATLKGFGWSDELVFRKAIPGICMGLLFSGLYYTYMAVKLARPDHCHPRPDRRL